MEAEKNRMRTIWFFVGLILFAIGVIVIAAGVYDLIFPANTGARLTNLHANIWWGGLILLAGLLYIVKNRNKYVDV